jgi:hypothetical protein
MSTTIKPRNLLEWTMNEHSARRTAERIAEEAMLPKHLTGEDILTADLPVLRKSETRDQSGRVITTFEGNCSAWMNDFSMMPKKIISIKTR